MEHSCIKIEPRETDYIQGVNSPIVFKAVLGNGDWTDHIDFFERQKIGFETDGCVLFTAQESFDAQINDQIENGSIPQWVVNKFTEMGYMDVSTIDGKPRFHTSPRFLQVLTGNGYNGNPLSAPWDVMRKFGALPWTDLPYDETTTMADYLAPIPVSLLQKAAKFLDLIGGKNQIQYHLVVNGTQSIDKMKAALPQAPLCMGTPVCDPWNQEQPPSCSLTGASHSTMAYKIDNFVETFDHYSPFLKKLGFDYPIPYVMQGIVTVNAVPPAPVLPANPTVQQTSNWLTQLFQWLQNILPKLKGRNLSAIPMNNYPWWVSSTGQGLAQRIVSLVALVLPILSAFGVNIAQGDVEVFVNAALIVAFGAWQLWAWARASFFKQYKLGKYAGQ